jgi:hypothetical protein
MPAASLLNLQFYVSNAALNDIAERATYDRIWSQLGRLKADGRIGDFEVLIQEEAFPTKEAQDKFLYSLRDFAMRSHIALRFGSNRDRYSWLPPRFLLVRDRGVLVDAFPSRVENGYFEPEDFLEAMITGDILAPSAWRPAQESRHSRIVDALAANPDLLEVGLRFQSKEVLVSSADSAESGRIDLLFRDRIGRYLIVEVKVTSRELDQALGQVFKHRRLFAARHHLGDEKLIRIAIACPDLLKSRIREFGELGVECFAMPADIGLA